LSGIIVLVFGSVDGVLVFAHLVAATFLGGTGFDPLGSSGSSPVMGVTLNLRFGISVLAVSEVLLESGTVLSYFVLNASHRFGKFGNILLGSFNGFSVLGVGSFIISDLFEMIILSFVLLIVMSISTGIHLILVFFSE
jgi:hypothetical protein